MPDDPDPAPSNEQLAAELDPTWKFWAAPGPPAPASQSEPALTPPPARGKYAIALVALVVLLFGGIAGWLVFGRSGDDGAAAASAAQPTGGTANSSGAAPAPSPSPSPSPSTTTGAASASPRAATTTNTSQAAATTSQPAAISATAATTTQPAGQAQPPQTTVTENPVPSPSVTQATQEPPKETTPTPPPSPSPSPPPATATSPGQWAYTITNASSTCDDQVKSSVGTAFAPLNVTVTHTGGSFSLQVSPTNTLSGSVDAGGNFSLVSNLTTTPGPGSLSIRAMQGKLNGSPGGTADGTASLIGADQCVVTVTFHLVLSNPV